MTEAEHIRPHLLIKYRKAKPLDRSVNIFDNIANDDQSQPINMLEQRRYSVVGDRLFVDRLIERLSHDSDNNDTEQPSKPSIEESSAPFMELEMTSHDMRKRLMNTTHQQTIFHSKLLSRMPKQKQLSYTRDKRNIDIFRAQQRYWENSQSLRNSRAKSHNVNAHKKIETVVQPETSRIYVASNPNQDAIINDNPTTYWRKSLRNNDPALLKYIEGVPIDKIELEKLLQTSHGTCSVEYKVPKLDMDVICSTEKQGGLMLSARSKCKSQFQAGTMTSSTSVYRNDRYPDHFEEVYKVEWNRRDLARKNPLMLPKMQIKQ